jgi:hypothetical protein
MAVFVTVASGFAVSSAVVLFPADRRWTVSVPSMTPVAVRVELSQTSGGGADFGPLHVRPDLSDVVVSGTPRPAWGIFWPVTSYARVKLGANASDVATFQLMPFTAR